MCCRCDRGVMAGCEVVEGSDNTPSGAGMRQVFRSLGSCQRTSFGWEAFPNFPFFVWPSVGLTTEDSRLLPLLQSCGITDFLSFLTAGGGSGGANLTKVKINKYLNTFINKSYIHTYIYLHLCHRFSFFFFWLQVMVASSFPSPPQTNLASFFLAVDWASLTFQKPGNFGGTRLSGRTSGQLNCVHRLKGKCGPGAGIGGWLVSAGRCEQWEKWGQAERCGGGSGKHLVLESGLECDRC